jgi:HAD superfamily hydrolase (TIGR01509 family)
MYLSAIKNFITKNKYPEFQLKAVFFDMDGVLLDSMDFHSIAWVKTMNGLNIPFTMEEAYMNEGRVGHDTINNAYLRTFGRVATLDEQETIYQIKTNHLEDLGEIHAMPYSNDLLNKVKKQGLEIYLVTGSGQLTLLESLEDYFPNTFVKEKMVTAFDVENGKPSPEPYLKALAKSGLNPWEVVVIENAPLGVESSTSAGLFTIGINSGPLDPDLLYTSGADIVFPGGMKELYKNWDDFYQVNLAPINA